MAASSFWARAGLTVVLATSSSLVASQSSAQEPAGEGPVGTKSTVFTHTSDFDGKGIVHYLAHQSGSFVNPAEAGLVTVTASSVMADSQPPAALLANQLLRFTTKGLPSSWVELDFGERRIIPTHYTLRHYSSWDTEALRSWVLEASVDGAQWATLRTHTNDAALTKKGSTHTWSIPATSAAYRKLRIRQTGLNSNNHHYLALSGFEVYGTLQEPKSGMLAYVPAKKPIASLLSTAPAAGPVPVPVTLGRGWSEYGHSYAPPAGARVGSLCVLTGLAKGSGGTIGTLPKECRPQHRLIFSVHGESGPVRVDVTPAGQIQYLGKGPGWVSLSGITFVK